MPFSQESKFVEALRGCNCMKTPRLRTHIFQKVLEENQNVIGRETRPTARYDVFISYNRKDLELVDKITGRLHTEEELQPFFDKSDLSPGDRWREKIVECLDLSASCAIFLGPSGFGETQKQEIELALDKNIKDKSFRIIPVLLPGANPDSQDSSVKLLRRFGWADFNDGVDDAAGFKSLVGGIRDIQEVSNFLRNCPAGANTIFRLLEEVEKNEGLTPEWRLCAITAFRALTKLPSQLSDDLVYLILDLGDGAGLVADASQSSLFITLLTRFAPNNTQSGINLVDELAEKLKGNRQQFDVNAWLGEAKYVLDIKPTRQLDLDNKVYLLTHLIPVDKNNNKFLLNYWALKNGRNEKLNLAPQISDKPQPFEKRAGEIQQLAAACRSQFTDVTVELVIPRDLFHHDVTQWKLSEDECLLRQLPLVFRCNERFRARQGLPAMEKRGQSRIQMLRTPKVRLSDWEAKCMQLRELAGKEAGAHCFGVSHPDQYDADDYADEFRKYGTGVFIALGFSPNSKNSPRWEYALNYGAPLAVWLRDTEINLQTLEEMLCKCEGSAIKLSELPGHIWQMQKDAIKSKNREDPKYHLSLLYDDYERVPAPN